MCVRKQASIKFTKATPHRAAAGDWNVYDSITWSRNRLHEDNQSKSADAQLLVPKEL